MLQPRGVLYAPASNIQKSKVTHFNLSCICAHALFNINCSLLAKSMLTMAVVSACQWRPNPLTHSLTHRGEPFLPRATYTWQTGPLSGGCVAGEGCATAGAWQDVARVERGGTRGYNLDMHYGALLGAIWAFISKKPANPTQHQIGRARFF